ncbi:MAG: hypothetical protein LBU34_14385 [Planctomycetaceae bacterium]|nr:hypothetical protein [Planctomycetaceae bacterium]
MLQNNAIRVYSVRSATVHPLTINHSQGRQSLAEGLSPMIASALAKKEFMSC